MKINVGLSELKNEIDLIRKRYPAFKDDSAFVFWFLHAYLTDKEETAKNALTGKEGGRGGEKNIDAIFIDDLRYSFFFPGIFYNNLFFFNFFFLFNLQDFY